MASTNAVHAVNEGVCAIKTTVYCCARTLLTHASSLFFAQALTFLHDKNIIHGDIKPQNVLLSKKPFSIVKICDFGNARYAKDVRYFSKTGSVSKVPYTCITGTHGYIAPEILNKQNYGPEIDVWAAGIMYVHLLSFVNADL